MKILQQQLDTWGWKPSTHRLLLGVSGGLDSMVMAHALYTLGYTVGIAHVHYGLRGAESQADADFVAQWAQQRQLPFYLLKPEQLHWTSDAGIQAQARSHRYAWFEQLRDAHGYQAICTAHHLNDALETTLFHLMRGTGLEGLIGFRSRQQVYRPLLQYTRAQLLQWAETEGWTWRHDSSNDKIQYTRNRIRQQLVPLMQSFNPALEASYAQSRQQWEHSLHWAQFAAAREWTLLTSQHQHAVRIDRVALLALPGWPQVLYWGLQPYGFAQWDEVQRLPYLEVGKKVYSPTHQLLQQRDGLWLSPLASTAQEAESWKLAPDQPCPLAAPIHVYATPVAPAPGVEIVAIDTTLWDEPLLLRHPQTEDYLYPNGMSGKKRLSKLLKEQGYSAPQQQRMWVIAAGSEVLWIPGVRLSRKVMRPDMAITGWWVQWAVKEMEK